MPSCVTSGTRQQVRDALCRRALEIQQARHVRETGARQTIDLFSLD